MASLAEHLSVPTLNIGSVPPAAAPSNSNPLGLLGLGLTLCVVSASIAVCCVWVPLQILTRASQPSRR